jgi:hypothetical protein
MTGRTRQILGRFPAHLDALRPGKLLQEVVDGLSRDLDVLAATLAAVRRSHRLADAAELRDLLLIGARHGMTLAEFTPLLARFRRSRTLLAELAAAANDSERDARAEALCDLWGLAAARPRLPLFAPPADAGGTPDLDAAQARLETYAGLALRYDRLLDAVRERIAGTCRLHAAGNGTVQALLAGAANALSLSLGEIQHSADRFWHAANVRDQIVLEHSVWQPDPDGGADLETSQPLPPAEEVLGMEENPIWRAEASLVPRRHGELFHLLRVGFERVLLQVNITGEADRTLGPMLVNRDEGHGIGYTRAVPAGKTLVFTEEGRVRLDGTDVTPYAFAWQGACFANAGDAPERSFLFDGEGGLPSRAAHFAVSTPAGALETDFVFPHAGDSIPMPGIAVGETRLAFFVQEAFFSALGGTAEAPVLRRVPPRPAVGFLDGAVFAPAPGESHPVAALVAFSWLEHRAFAVRLLLPPRFQYLHADDPEGTETRRRIAQSLQRFRSAGIDVRVEFADDRWVLGQGALMGADIEDPINRLQAGTVLWAAPPDA